MGELWPVAAYLTDLRTLPVYIKPDWRGVTARLVGAVLWLGELLRIKAASRAMDEYAQTIGGAIYARRGGTGQVRRSLALHESNHDYQQRTRGAIRYLIAYYLSRKYRAHAECQSYGLEVAINGVSLHDAASSAADPIYRLGLSHADCAVLIGAYAERWTQDCEGVTEQRRAT